jgi:hypothetical protein
MDTTGLLYSTTASQSPANEYYVLVAGLKKRFSLDKLHFVRETETCSAGTKVSLSGWSTPALNDLQTVTAAAMGAVQNSSSSTLFRLCVERTFQKNTANDPYPTGTFASTSTKWIDFSGVTFMMSDLEVVQHFVTRRANIPVTLRGASALLPTDTVWFTSAVDATKTTTTACGVSPPTSAGATVTNAVTVTGLEANSEVTLHFNFESMTLPATAAGTSLGLCIARGTTIFSPGITLILGMTTLANSNNPAAESLSCGDTTGCFAVGTGLGAVRQETRNVKMVNAATGSGLPWQATDGSITTSIGFVEVTSDCPEAVMTSSNSAGSLTLPVGAAPGSANLVFSSTAVSNVLRRLCRTVTNTTNAALIASSTYYKSYENIGVIVTDLTIQGSSKTDLYTLGCVSALESQSVSFAASTTTALSGYSLWFESPSIPCGGVPANAVVAPVATINGATATWSASFNFSSVTAGKSVYRLCAAKGNTVLDFAPLGVRVVSITLNANTNPLSTAKAASVKPLANQTVQISISSGNNIASGDKVFFITEMAGVTCHCVNSGNCVGQLPAQTDKLTFTASGPYQFDFSTFSAVTAAKATMCVTDSAGALVYSYACQSVSFDATISPAIVPANYGQIVQVTYTGNSVAVGDQVMFTTTASCPTNDTFATAKTSSYKYNTDAVTVATSGTALTFNFTGMWIYKDVTAKMCVLSGNDVFMLSGATITVGPSVVGIAGDPHVRSANGEWLDFYGATGVYNVYSGPQMVANAKFGFAVRDNHMIWHPKVMRPGTMVEEVGIKLLEAGISLRLGVYGGGLLSIRESLKPTEFLTAKNSKEVQVGNYNIAWEPCTKDCTVVMPWGTHERSHSLTVQGEGEFMQLFVAHSGGYRFIDIEAQPAASSTGLLADALMAPLALADRLRSGGEKDYVLQSAALLSA